ncbi:uncharacterized membrane protein YebE (DUF533 family) [Skermanella aerolata]|uniref:tellurite resistance TerB family protein n=1 Tax=Skermanella aerolata TaxID=393310 RepID=UPI003D21ACBA
MANLQNILGTMLATGMAGRSRRGPSFAAGNVSGGGFRNAAGLASLGYLAYKAWQERQQNMGPTSGQQQPGSGSTGGASAGGIFGSGGLAGIGESIFGGGSGTTQGAGSGTATPASTTPRTGSRPSLGERLVESLKPHEQPEARAAAETMGDQKALLLIRAMIAAANADGQISAVERQRILGKLDEAGADADDRRTVEQELQQPRSLDALLRDVTDPETAEQVYLASEMAIDTGSPAEKSYLQYLAARLNLPDDRVQELNRIV